MKSKIKAIGFDFDGTLLMSENKKVQAIVAVFKEEFKITKGVKKYYQELVGTGKNRDEKVKMLFQKFLNREPTNKELKKVADHFGRHYENSFNSCPLFKCTNLIKELKKQVKFMFILSLENKKEVKKIANKCNYGKYFDEILGGPKTKIENIKHILKKHNLKPSEIIYVGDSKGDLIASNKMNIKFVLINKKFSYQQLKNSLGADFVFSSVCDLPININKLIGKT
jgi:phosphoglycolate phosphatase